MLKKLALAIAGLVVVALALVAVLVAWSEIDPQHMSRTLNTDDAAGLVSNPAPEFTLKRIGGDDEVSLSDFHGKFVILDFWASWCSPCEDTSPHLEAVRAQNDDVVVIAINVREGEKTTAADLEKHVAEYFVEKGYGFTNVLGDQKVMDQYKTQGIPHVFIIDGKGIVRYSGVGRHSQANVEEAVAVARASAS